MEPEIKTKLNEDMNDLEAEFGEKILEEINNSQDEHLKTKKCPLVDEKNVELNEPLESSQWDETASGTLLIHKTSGLLAKEKVG